MSRSVPSRALDPIYDTVYTVSRSGGTFRKGVYRSSSKAATTSRVMNNQNPAAEGSQLVSGKERVKFHQRPVLPYILAEPPEVLLANPKPPGTRDDAQQLTSSNVDADLVRKNTRSVGIQTAYRDSEAQTDPYTPDYTIQNTAAGTIPEIVSLSGLSYMQGQLPVGQAELEFIERNREKRLFESSLPPVTDEASFQLRKAMLEAEEIREWAYREAEIDAFHEKRIAELQQALAEREKESAYLSEQRLEVLRERLLYEKETALERIKQERVAALRKLSKKQDQRRSGRGRDIIAEYANFGSQVYAPVTRDGKAGKNDVRESGIEKPCFLRLDALRELENALPRRMMQLVVRKFKSREDGTAKERKKAAIEAHLLKMEYLVNKDKVQKERTSDGTFQAHQGVLSTVIARTSQTQHALMRPPIPNYALADAAGAQDHEVEDATRLLQKLLRGRAVQNMMFEDRERRVELIAELRAADEQHALRHRNNVALSRKSGEDAIDSVANAAAPDF